MSGDGNTHARVASAGSSICPAGWADPSETDGGCEADRSVERSSSKAPLVGRTGFTAVLARGLGVLFLAAASAALYAVAQPPIDYCHASWVCLIPLLMAISACRSAWGAALAAVGFAVLFSSAVAGWLPGAVAVFFQVTPLEGWSIALAVYALFAALPLAMFGAVAHRVLRQGSARAIAAGIPVLWVATELVRSSILGGLPWGLLGHALYRETLLIQMADVAGVFGVSALVAMVNAALFLSLLGTPKARRTLAPLAAAVGLVGVVAVYGVVRVGQFATDPSARPVTVGVVQSNQSPVYHWTSLAAERALSSHVRLTQDYFGTHRADLIVWPENAIPLYPANDPSTAARLARLAAQMRASLIVGAPAAGNAAASTRFNAAHLVRPGTASIETYRKQRLVPFAEYRPFGDGDTESAFAAGDQPTGFRAAGLQWGPTICLDLIYPDVTRASVLAGAEALVNLSNDSWLMAGGRGAAMQQYAQAVFRAVENRRDVVRAATTGISAVVDATGAPLQVLSEGRAGAFVAPVSPRRMVTLYTRWGDVFALGCLAFAAAMAFYPTSVADRRYRGERQDA